MIEFEHVYKTHETHNDENVALEDINIHIEEGRVCLYPGTIPVRANPLFKAHPDGRKAHEGKVFINGQDLTRIRRRKVPICAARWALCSRTSA